MIALQILNFFVLNYLFIYFVFSVLILICLIFTGEG